MKCPKCNYLSFEAGERCRNCGYDFSMAAPVADDPAADLPLFDLGDDAPLVSVPASPRPPLSVRRTGPRPQTGAQSPARLESRQPRPAPSAPPVVPAAPPAVNEPNLDFDLGALDDSSDQGSSDQDEDSAATPAAVPLPRRPSRESGQSAVATDDSRDPREAAPAGRRLLAAAIDLLIVGSIDATVVYFTLRLAGLDSGGFFALPIVPLGAFLLLLNGGYVVMFTAATGQTIGKMAAGIRVVGTSAGDVINDRVSFGRAVLRTAGYFASLLPAGLGFVPAFFGAQDHRALHDRLAETRVVNA